MGGSSSSKSCGSRRSSSNKSNGSRKSKGKLPVTVSTQSTNSSPAATSASEAGVAITSEEKSKSAYRRAALAAGGALAVTSLTAATLVGGPAVVAGAGLCITILGAIDRATDVYYSAHVDVEVARGLAKDLHKNLKLIQKTVEGLQAELKQYEREDAARSTAHYAIDGLDDTIFSCYQVLRDFSVDYENALQNEGAVKQASQKWTWPKWARKSQEALTHQYKSVADQHLPALKHQPDLLTLSLELVNTNLALLRDRNSREQGAVDMDELRLRHDEQHRRHDEILNRINEFKAAVVIEEPATAATVLFDQENLPMDVEFFFDPHDLQKELRQRLYEPSNNGRFSLAGTGQAGVGKSVMAARYCLDVTKGVQRYQLVWWILAEKRETCIQSLQGLLECLVRRQKRGKLPESIASVADLKLVLEHEPGSSEWVKALKELLMEAQASWLLVFDNYSRHVSVEDLIPPSKSSSTQLHHVLLTTRDDTVDHPLDVRLWTLEESQRFFAEKVFCFKRSDGVVPNMLLPENKVACDQQVHEVCCRVDGLPLALALIARDLHREWRRKRDYDLTSILRKWDQLAKTRKVAVAEPAGQRKQEQTMDAILLMARDRLSSNDTEVKAAGVDAVLASVAYVAADNIPIDVLQCDEIAVEWLVERALLTEKDGTFNVHRLTQDAMRRRQEASGNATTANQAVLLLLGKAMQSDDEKLRQRVRVHAAIAMSRAQHAGVEIPDEVADVLQKLSLRAAIDDEDTKLLQKIQEDNPTAMAQKDAEGLHAFHHAFLGRRNTVMHWLVSEVRDFREPSTIAPTKGCSLDKFELNNYRRIEDEVLMKLVVSLAKVTTLTTLSLDRNQLTSLPKNLGALTNLTTLNLANNQLTSLPKELGALTNLTELTLRGNRLTDMELSALPNLLRFDLRGNQLTSLPESLGKLTSLENLYVDHNQLMSLPKEMGALTSLKIVDLDDNQLMSLSKELGALMNLETLYLSNNNLTSLSPALGMPTNLKTLWLHHNKLRRLPEKLGTLTNLTTLSLHNNQLTSLPKELGALTNLARLDLANNQLTSDDIPAPLQERAIRGALTLRL